MADSISSTSPTSASTFSFGTTATSGSHYTSEEQPDLGAGFRTVLREWTYLQPPPRIPTYIQHYSALKSSSHTEDGRRSTVWTYEPIAQYLEDPETETDTDTTRSVHIETETEIEPSASSTASPTVSMSLVDDYTLTLRTQPSPPASGSLEFEFDFEHDCSNLEYEHEREGGPSLGYLDQALSFIAAERAQLATRTSQSQSDAWRHVIDSPNTAIRRKQRRRKPKPPSLFEVSVDDDNDEEQSYHHTTDPEDSDDDAEGDDEQSPYYHSIPKYQSKSTPLTPRPRSPSSLSPTSTLTPSFSLPLQSQAQPPNTLSSSDSPLTSSTPGGLKRPARKRTRTKHRKPPVPSSASLVYPPSLSAHTHTHTLTHARSVPSLGTLHEKRKEGVGAPDERAIDIDIDSPTQKIISLARYLAKISPTERGVLEGVERKMVVRALRRARAGRERVSKNENKEEDKEDVGKGREEDGEDILDPRGRAPREGDPPVHVFVDHSNILFGLLTYLKRHPHLATTTSPHQTLRTGMGNINIGQGPANDNGKFQSRVDFNILDTITRTEETKEKTMTMKEKKEMKEIVVPTTLPRPTTTTTITGTSTNTNRNASANSNINTPTATNPTFVATNLPTSTPGSLTTTPLSTSTPTESPTKHTTPIPLPSFATVLARNNIMANSSTGPTKPSSPTKTRTRSRSRKVRKAAQHAMTMTDDCDRDRDVVLLGAVGEASKVKMKMIGERRSLRVVARAGVDGEGRVVLEDGEREGEADGEGEGEDESERKRAREKAGEEDGKGEGQEFEIEGTGTGTGDSGQESGSGGVMRGQGQGEGEICEQDGNGDGDGDEDEKAQAQAQTEKKTRQRQKHRHLSHTALALILERGRVVSRRVAVTSSPLYQPMDTLERLGYEVRVYIRVPDLGDGMDRTAKKKSQSHKRHLSGETTSGGDGSGAGSGSSGTSPLKSTLASHLSSAAAQSASLTSTSTSTVSATPVRVRYREQGVDELLQLKLHQALAATDDVPPGATIVLATGDGNVGQFSEDGFLGPVRTALKRGWRVELYAWEEGLSRAWRREFGLGSEWARNGMFQIIGMEQFAASLVKGGL